jgi:hypothetical protein
MISSLLTAFSCQKALLEHSRPRLRGFEGRSYLAQNRKNTPQADESKDFMVNQEVSVQRTQNSRLKTGRDANG